MASRLRRLLGVTVLLLGLSACVTTPPPLVEYSIARAALEAARSVDAAVHSPGHWSRAEEAYRQAELLFAERMFSEARAEFNRARVSAERAENAARVIRAKSGDIL